MMAGVATTCEECEGKRFQASVLDHHLGGRDIREGTLDYRHATGNPLVRHRTACM